MILSVATKAKNELINITAQVQQCVTESKKTDGIVHVFIPHTTAAVTINENADPDVVSDFINGLNRIVPESGFMHNEGNSPAHIKASLVGCSEMIIFEKSKLCLGTWQGIFFCEFDGPRSRKIKINIT